MDKSLLAKLKIKPGSKLLLLNSPDELIRKFGKADLKITTKASYEAVVLFIKTKAELDKLGSKVLSVLVKDTILWICYPKKSGTIKTDITRDHGWESLNKSGFEGVAMVSVDATWSAFRFRSKNKIKAAPQAKNSSLKKASEGKKVFEAVLERPDNGIDGAYVSIPFDVEQVYGTKGHVKVKAKFNGHPYRGILANMGTGCHIIIVRKDVRNAIGKQVGDRVTVEIELDTEERTIAMPVDLEDALKSHPKAKKFFDGLSYTNRKEYVNWITSAKRSETRSHRLKEAIRKLTMDMKNPAQKENT